MRIKKKKAEGDWEAVASKCYPCRWEPLSTQVLRGRELNVTI